MNAALLMLAWFLPTPYVPEVILISTVSPEVIRTICDSPTTQFGCTLITGKVVRIYVGPEVTNCQLLHELKHATGWKHRFQVSDCY